MKRGRLEKLECIRGFAAFYVVLHHLSRTFLPHRWYRMPFVFGPEAVIVFFVLSGFVIHYSTRAAPSDLQLRNYAVKRVRRIYPIFLCALLAGYLSRAIVLRSWFVPDWKTLGGNLVMYQGISIFPFFDGPLWSLSYEWWFYVLFFVVVKLERLPGRQQYWAAAISVIGLAWALIHLNQASLFLFYLLIWWSGVELARQYVDEGRITWRRQAFTLGGLSLLGVLSLLLVFERRHEYARMSFIEFPLLFPRNFLAAVVLICMGIAWHKRRFVGFDRIFGVFAALAPISYGIYVVHVPVIDAVESFWPGRYAVAKVAIVFALTLGLAWVLEVQMQAMVNRWSKRLLTGKPVGADATPKMRPAPAC